MEDNSVKQKTIGFPVRIAEEIERKRKLDRRSFSAEVVSIIDYALKQEKTEATK